jgi:hypothetical protein
MIETSGFCVSFDLAVPGIVKIDLRQLLEKLALLLLIKVLNRIYDFYYRAHGVSLLPAFRFVCWAILIQRRVIQYV